MRLLKNISYTLLSNLLNTFVSAFIVLIIPKFIGVREYGMWQVFIFYAGYAGVLHLGWADGLFLRRGGQHIEDTNPVELKSESLLFLMFNIFIGIVISGLVLFVNPNYDFIVFALGFGIIVINFRTWITMILQATGNFKEYSINLTAQSLIYISLLVFFLLVGIRDYKFMIVAYIISQAATSVSGLIQIKPYFFKKGFEFHQAFAEAKLNISSGSKLMIANFTALLIVGVIRFGIQQKWSVATFGKVSLILTVANLFMVFINAVSLVLFPSLRRTDQKIVDVYSSVKGILIPLLFTLMILYFPLRIILPIWLPAYASAIKYAAVLMPMMVYQGKFEILSNTFMKDLRMEAYLLEINLFTLCCSFAAAYVTIIMMHSLNFAVFSIAIVLAIRSVIAEVILNLKLKIELNFSIVFETIMVVGFMFLAWYSSIIISFIVYIILLSCYLALEKKSIISGWQGLRKLSSY